MLARLAVAAMILQAGLSVPQAQSLSRSTWKSQQGSILTIDAVDAEGAFTGTYENKAQANPCQDIFEMKGRVKGSRVNFVVVWNYASEKCGDVTIWHGTLVGAKITSQWELAHGNTDTGRLDVKRGNDVFDKQF